MSPPINTETPRMGDYDVPRTLAKLAETMDRIDKTLTRLDIHVTGGDKPQNGLNHRVLVIEQSVREIDERRKKVAGVAWAGLAAGFGALLAKAASAIHLKL